MVKLALENFKVLRSCEIANTKVANFNTSCLEAHADFFRLLMKEIFDPFDKKFIS